MKEGNGLLASRRVEWHSNEQYTERRKDGMGEWGGGGGMTERRKEGSSLPGSRKVE